MIKKLEGCKKHRYEKLVGKFENGGATWKNYS
jgi:hypothetical protein